MTKETGENGTPPRRRRDAAATRRALLSATRSLLTEHGVAGTSTRDIATLAGVNQALVYRYFGSKEKLVAEAAGGGDPSVDVGTTPMAEVPRRLLEDMFERSEAAADRDGAAFWSLVGGANDEVVRDALRGHIDTMFGERLAERLDGPDPAVRAELFAALLTGLAFLRTKIETPALSGADRDTIADYVDRVAVVLIGDDGDGGGESGPSTSRSSSSRSTAR